MNNHGGIGNGLSRGRQTKPAPGAEPPTPPLHSPSGFEQAMLNAWRSTQKDFQELTRTLRLMIPGRLQDLVELKKKTESGQWVPYEIKTFELDASRQDESVPIEGDFIHAWTDGVLDGIGVRLARKENDLVYFKRRNPIAGFSFWELFLTNPAQAGKTLDLMIGREASAEAATSEITLSSSQFPETLSAGGNLKTSIEEAGIAIPSDIQARYNLKSTRDVAVPGNSTDYWLPETGSIDLSNFLHSSWFIKKATNKPSAVELHVSLDAGVSFVKAEGYEIAEADFELDTWNTIDVPLMLAEAKLLVTSGAVGAGALNMGVIRKA